MLASTPYQPYASLHENPQGPGDKRPTCREILQDAGEHKDLKGKVVLITGCTGGIGIETARAMYTTGAQLFLTARDASKMESIIEHIVNEAAIDSPRPQALQLSLDSLSSIHSCVEDFKKRSNKLNILIENAGVMAVPYSKTIDGFETHFGTNHLGHFYLFQLLKPLLLRTAAEDKTSSRVVVVSSAGHRRGPVDLDNPNWIDKEYEPISAYGLSKTANIWMANELDRRYSSNNLHAVSLHPGMIWTDIGRHMNEDQLKSLGVYSDATKRIEKNADQGAATTVWAAVSPYFEKHGGVYLADCGECSAGVTPTGAGYSPHAYDEASERRLWEMSCEMVGVDANQ